MKNPAIRFLKSGFCSNIPLISLRHCVSIIWNLKEHQRQNISQWLNWIEQILLSSCSKTSLLHHCFFFSTPTSLGLGSGVTTSAKPFQPFPASPSWRITQYLVIQDPDNMTLELIVHPSLYSLNCEHSEGGEGDFASRSSILALNKNVC